MTKIASASLCLILVLALAACASVLGFKPAADPSHPFEHRAHVLHGVACTDCHAGIASAKAGGVMHLPSAATCRGCHAKPHDEHDCTGCHGETSSREAATLVHDQLRFDHAAHVATVRGNCARCHEGVASQNPAASLEPKMAMCFGCHEHQNEWNARACNGCHVDVAAEGTPPESHVVHDGDFIREHGARAASNRDLCASCHDDRSCSKCHGATVAALPWKLAVGDAPQTTGIHLSGFMSRHALEARANPSLCTTCHSEDRCVACHNARGVGVGSAGVRSPHPPGWVTATGGNHGSEARIDPMSCAGCHGGGGEQLCVGCHRVGGPGGNPHGPGFASRKDKTRELPCRLCHGAGP